MVGVSDGSYADAAKTRRFDSLSCARGPYAGSTIQARDVNRARGYNRPSVGLFCPPNPFARGYRSR